jgi:hypothetical protein
VLEAAYGQDRLARDPPPGGFTSFNLMLAHRRARSPGAIARGSWARSPAMLWDLTVDYPGMLLPSAVARSAVSERADEHQGRARTDSVRVVASAAPVLPTSASGLALAAPAVDGQEFPVVDTAGLVFWWTAWACAAAAIIVFRIGVHDLAQRATPAARHGRRTRRPIESFSVYVAGRRPGSLRSEAGQFFSWRFLGRPWLDAGQPVLTVRRAGRPRSAHHRPGRRRRQRGACVRASWYAAFLVEGPFGAVESASPHRSGGSRLIGAGVGITPSAGSAEGLDYAPARRDPRPALHRRPLFSHELQALRAPARPGPADRAPAIGAKPRLVVRPGADELDDLQAAALLDP